MIDNIARLEMAQEESAVARSAPPAPRWPVLGEEAVHGVTGRFLRKLEPDTEADPAGVLIQFLVMAGNLIGRGPHFVVEADQHHVNLFAALVGESSKGRKGVSAGQARRLFETVDPDWCRHRIQHGLSSGEGLIWAIRDPIEKTEAIREKGKATGEYETVIVDQGVEDKRLLLIESELASALKVLKRESNILSPVLRSAWDSGDLKTLTKNQPATATGAHVSVIGHITKTELVRQLDATEAANGFGNRFLWCCVRRSKCLPEGGASHEIDFSPEIAELNEAVSFARNTNVLSRDEEARALWASVYPELSEGKPGLLGSMIGRAEAQAMRLACLYALLDQSPRIRSVHLLAALAVWDYCEGSARWIFGDSLGDPVADEILRALRQSPEGLSRNEIGRLFSGHRPKKELGRALLSLSEQGLATRRKKPTGGRSLELWLATVPEHEGREEAHE